jgi:hypothetical protein
MLQSSFILDFILRTSNNISLTRPNASFVRDSRGGEERPGHRTSNLASCGASNVEREEPCGWWRSFRNAAVL